jgi:hypothetical protein
MPTIKYKEDEGGVKRIVIKDGKVSCECCTDFQLTIKYDWSGTGMRDLDTKTTAFGESVGWSCGGSGTYVQWISGDNRFTNGFEQVDVLVDTARTNELWTSSYNIQCFAGWYSPAGGSGPANLIVEYKNKTKNKSISPGSQFICASTGVATVTVYSTIQPDGSYFEIV